MRVRHACDQNAPNSAAIRRDRGGFQHRGVGVAGAGTMEGRGERRRPHPDPGPGADPPRARTTARCPRSSGTCSPAAAAPRWPRTSRRRRSSPQSPRFGTAPCPSSPRRGSWASPGTSSSTTGGVRNVSRGGCRPWPTTPSPSTIRGMPASTAVGRTRSSLSSAPITGPRSTLRYLDGLPVPEVAECLDRTVHATETLLVRARRAFRHVYEAGRDDGR